MERRVTVNDGIERLELELPEGMEPEGDLAQPPGNSNYGPCLHLGTRGERCARPALEVGYCAKHHPNPALRSPARPYARVLFATFAIVMIDWPYVADLVHDLIRWLASR